MRVAHDRWEQFLSAYLPEEASPDNARSKLHGRDDKGHAVQLTHLAKKKIYKRYTKDLYETYPLHLFWLALTHLIERLAKVQV